MIALWRLFARGVAALDHRIDPKPSADPIVTVAIYEHAEDIDIAGLAVYLAQQAVGPESWARN